MWQRVIESKWSLIIAFLALAQAGLAQPKLNSPLSRFGLGDLQDREFIATYNMGRIGAIYHHPYVTNLVNPASLGFIEATSFEAAISARVAEMEKDGFTQTVWSGNLEYLSLTIPFVNQINEILDRKESVVQGSMNISLAPYSNVGYLVNSFGDVDSVGQVNSNFRGSGGTSRFNFGTGWKWRNLAVGVNGSYLFGNLQYESETVLADVEYNYEHVSRRNYSINGFLYDLGVMYAIPLSAAKNGNPRSITVGGHWNGSTKWKGKEDYLNYVLNPTNLDADTAINNFDAQVNGRLPGQFGIGFLMEQKAKWRAGMTFSQMWWSAYENSARPESFKDTWKLSAGASWTPNYNSILSYLARVEYRAGAYYQTDPRSLDGGQVAQYGFLIGAGFPFIQQRYFSFLDLSIEYGWRGVTDNLNENYLRFKLGINLNDTEWFIKRRYN